jgi:phosphoglycerate dehydrogenase-like enzyme
MTRRVVAWIAQGAGREALGNVSGGDGREALGALPPEVTLADAPGPDVEFAVPNWGVPFHPASMPSLRVVQVRSAGVDWIIDEVPEGITLCSARGTRDAAMAEWIVAALLADAKRLGPFARADRWHRGDIFDLAGHRVVILGHGSSGRATARLLAPFGCEVVGVARRARDGVHAIDELDALLPTADALVNLLPLTPATRGLVDAGVLARLRDGALYINLGRGPTTDTGALVAELRRERLRAVLDVVDPEPLPDDHPLWTAPGALISPHVAGDTPAGDRAAWRLVGEQLARYVAGEPLRNVVRDGY